MTLPYIGDETGSLPDLTEVGKSKEGFADKIKSVLNWGVSGDNPIDNALFGTPEERKKKQIEAQNRDKNMMKIITSGFGMRDTPEAKQVRDAWNEGMRMQQEAAKTTEHDVLNMFGKAKLSDLDEWVESIRPKGKTLGERAGGAALLGLNVAKGLVEMPLIMAEQLFQSTFVPLDLSAPEITPLLVEKQVEAQKGTLANIAAIAVAPVVSKAMGAMHEGLAARAATSGEALTANGAQNVFRESVSTAPELTAKAATQKYAIGAVGRAVLDDFTAAATSGMAWGAISNANEDDVVEGMMNGLMLAPIGVITGFVRGAKEKMSGEVFGPDKVPAMAKNVLFANQLKLTSESSIQTAVNNVRSALASNDFIEAVAVGAASVHPASFVLLNSVDDAGMAALKNNFAGLEVHKFDHPFGKGNLVMVSGPEFKITPQELADFKTKGVPPRNRPIVSVNGKEYYYKGTNGQNVIVEKFDGSGTVSVHEDNVRWTTTAAPEVIQDAVVKNMFNEFESTYGFENGSFKNNLRQFLSKKGHTEKLESFAVAFSDIFNKKYAGEAKAAHIQRFENEFLSQHTQMVVDASTNGMYIHEVGTTFEVRDMKDSSKLFASKKLSEIRKFLKEAGQVSADELLPVSVPTQAIPTPAPPPAPAITNNPFQIPHPEGSTAASRWVAKFDMRHPAITAFVHFLDGNDVTHGTNFGALYKEARDVYNRTREKISNTFEKDPDLRTFKSMVETLPTEKRELLVARMEAMSAEEIRKEYGMTNKAQTVADEIANSGEDVHRIQQYKRISEGILERHQSLAHERALDEIDRLDKQNLKPGEFDNKALEILKQFREATSTSPAYLADIQKLRAEVKPSPAFDKAVADLTANASEQQAISRLVDAIVDKENYGLSQSEFDIKHGFTQMDKAVAAQMEKIYAKFGSQFGIPNHRLVPHYVNHYRSYGDTYEPTLDALQAGMKVKGIRQFASQMVRTGEVVTYHRDPLQVVQAYIRSGIKGEQGGFYSTMDALSKRVEEEQSKMMNKIERDEIGARWADFDAVLSGRNVLEAERANAIQQQYYRNMGMNPRQISDIMAQPSALASILALTNSSLMGARIVMGARDAWTAVSTFYAFHGLDRTINFLKQAVDKDTMKRLQETGVITKLDYESLYETSTAGSGVSGRAAGVTKKLADVGFKLSGQGHVNILAQGAAYMESLKFVSPKIDAFLKKKITLEQLKKDIFFNSFDEHVKKTFLTELTNGQAEPAAKAIAYATRDRIAGQFGVGSGTSGGSSSFGKIFNQMGSWSIQNRSVMMKAFTKGTSEERLGVALRHIGAQSALLAAGGVAGFNFTSWVMAPQNMMFFGGPLIDAAQVGKAALDATVGGSDTQKEYSYRQAKRTARMFVPFGYAIRSVEQAWKLSNGTGFGMGRIGAQALGVQVKSDEGYQSWWDEWNNNYPSLR